MPAERTQKGELVRSLVVSSEGGCGSAGVVTLGNGVFNFERQLQSVEAREKLNFTTNFHTEDLV